MFYFLIFDIVLEVRATILPKGVVSTELPQFACKCDFERVRNVLLS